MGTSRCRLPGGELAHTGGMRIRPDDHPRVDLRGEWIIQALVAVERHARTRPKDLPRSDWWRKIRSFDSARRPKVRSTTVILLLAALAVGGWYGYRHWYAKSAAFPVQRLLTDIRGRTVSVRILARDDDEVRFVRLSDNTAYRYPIDSLSVADREFLRRYPVTLLPSTESPTPSLADPSVRSSPATVAADHLRRERAELEHQIELLQLELEKEAPVSPKLSKDQLKKQIAEHQNRIIDIDEQLLDMAFRARQGAN